ncbi:MAG TPA: hypothetical protein PK718_01640 [Candidatus Methanofastidiosa archaeon]|nr:hypothetical protein [Candidatus Methanofastidiosa archaeon]
MEGVEGGRFHIHSVGIVNEDAIHYLVDRRFCMMAEQMGKYSLDRKGHLAS